MAPAVVTSAEVGDVKRPPPYLIVAIVGAMIGLVLLVAPSRTSAQDLARVYSEEKVVGLLLKIGMGMVAALLAAIGVLWRRAKELEDYGRQLAAKDREVFARMAEDLRFFRQQLEREKGLG